MNIFVGNASKYFFPLFTLNSAYYADVFALLFVLVHVLLTLLCCFLTVQTCSIVKTVHVFHPNMSSIIVTILAQWFEILVAKLIILPYQLGFVTVGEGARIFQLWISNSASEMPHIQNPGDIAPLFVSGVLFLHYAFTVVFSVFILTCERAFATFFIEDYEKKPRAYICISLLLVTHSLTLLLSCLATCEIIAFTTGIAISGIIIVGAVMIYFVILHINVRIQKRLEKNDDADYYSLAIRFQAKENARSLELAKKVVVFAAVAVLFGMFLLVVAAFHLIDNHISTLVTLAEAVFNLNPLFVVPLGMYSVPNWRQRFVKKMPFRRVLRTLSVRKRTPKVSAFAESSPVKESEIYFNQLSEAWK